MRAHAVRSEDNHFFYSYDGEWKHGRMDGRGTYKFADGHTYKVSSVGDQRAAHTPPPPPPSAAAECCRRQRRHRRLAAG